MGSNTASQTEAVLLAQSKMSEILASGSWQDDRGALLSGDFTDYESAMPTSTTAVDTLTKFRWEALVEEWLDPSLLEVSVRVSWEWRGVERDVVLTTLVYTQEAQQ